MNTIGLPLIAGFIAGVSLLGVQGSMILCVVALALILAAARASSSPLVSLLIFGASCSAVAGYWVPEALRALGATTSESYSGFALATLWSSMPGFTVLAAIAHATRRLRRKTWIAVFCFSLAAIETALLSIPGFVPWILFGYAAIEQTGLAQLAALGGVPLVSVALVICAEALACLARPSPRRSSRGPFAILAGFTATAIVGLPFAQFVSPPNTTDAAPIRFVAIQPKLPRPERLRPSLQEVNTERLVRFTQHAIEAFPQTTLWTLVVWPENSILDKIDDRPRAEQIASAAAQELGRPLILGTTSRLEADASSVLRNRASLFSATGRLRSNADKVRTVPAIESSGHGWLESLARRAVGAAGEGPKIDSGYEIAPMAEAGHAVVTLCFEILFPDIVEKRRPEVATALLNLSDTSWIEDAVVSRQMITIARYRAIEQRLPLIRVAQGSGSAHFDAYGGLVEALPPGRYGALVVDALPTHAPQAMERGMILALPCGAALLAWLLHPLLGRSVAALCALRLDLRITKGCDHLPNPTRRIGLHPTDPHDFRSALPRRQVARPEERVPKNERVPEVVVRFFADRRVMPAMELADAENPREGT